MNSEEAYKRAGYIAVHHKMRLGLARIEYRDAQHEIYAAWLRRGGDQDNEGLEVKRMHFDCLEMIRKRSMQMGWQRYKPKAMWRNRKREVSLESMQDSLAYHDRHMLDNLYLEEMRALCGGRFLRLIDAMIKGGGEQKEAAKILGVSGPAVSQQMKRLRQAYAAA